MRFAFLLCLAVPLLAQVGGSIITPDEFLKSWENSKKFTIEVAQAMPAGKYTFKASDAEMSFGALMVHISQAQVFRFQQISGTKPPPPAKPNNKEEVIALLNASFDFVLGVIPKLTAGQLSQSYKVDWRDRPEATGREVMLNMFMHTAHHRAQAEVYLRLNGITPPVYLF